MITRIEKQKVNRGFRSWFSDRMKEADGREYRIVNGVLFAVAVLFFGIFMVVIGIVGLVK